MVDTPNRILAIDPGTKRIGLAVSDPLGITAQGLPSIQVETPEQALKALLRLAGEYEVAEFVVGWPLNMDGSRGAQAGSAEALAGELRASGFKVKMWDERLTSAQAEGVLLSADVGRKKRKQITDKLAAQILLQSYLDSRPNPS
ncbi:MAG: Holliday junction resolvase RuvX [Candidatus Omnitrophica bacterium]|nr:Holliday junction resolvase RuvX [Candidatus Omnitrophota bacterium]